MGELALKTPSRIPQAAPLSIRVEPTLKEQIAALAKDMNIKPHKLVVACLRLGLRDLGEDRTEMRAALQLALDAETAEMNLAQPKATKAPAKKTPAKESATKKTTRPRA